MFLWLFSCQVLLNWFTAYEVSTHRELLFSFGKYCKMWNIASAFNIFMVVLKLFSLPDSGHISIPVFKICMVTSHFFLSLSNLSKILLASSSCSTMIWPPLLSFMIIIIPLRDPQALKYWTINSYIKLIPLFWGQLCQPGHLPCNVLSMDTQSTTS